MCKVCTGSRLGRGGVRGLHTTHLEMLLAVARLSLLLPPLRKLSPVQLSELSFVQC